MKKVINTTFLILVLLLISGYYLISTTSGLGIILSLVNGEEIQVSAEVKTGSLLTGFELDNIKVVSDSGTVAINTLRLEWDLFEFLFTEKRIQSLVLTDAIVVVKDQSEATNQSPVPVQVPNLFVNKFSISNLEIQSHDDTGLIHVEQMQADIQILENTLSFSDFHIRQEDLDINSSGSVLLQLPYTMSVATDVRYTTPAERQLAGKISISGELDQFRTTVDIPNGNVTIIVSDITTSPLWTADLSISDFRPDQIDDALPEVGITIDLGMTGTATTATGYSAINLDYPDEMDTAGEPGAQEAVSIPNEFQLDFDTRLDTGNHVISFNELSISTGDITLITSGIYNFLENQFNIIINWQDLSFAANDNATAAVTSGFTTLDGTPDAYNISSTISILGSGLIPSTSLSVLGRGNLDSLQLSSLDFELLDGGITAVIDVSWVDAIEVGASWVGEGLDPGVIWPDWTGSLDTFGSVQLFQINDAWSWTSEDIRLSGQLNDAPLTMTMSGNNQGTGDIDISANANYANLDIDFSGTVGNELDVSWEVNSPDLARIHASLAGMFESTGELTGTRDFPEINADVTASNVGSPWGSARLVSANISSGIGSDSAVTAVLYAEDISINVLEIDSVQANLEGFRESHEFSFNANFPDMEIMLSAAGSYMDSNWQGQLKRLDVLHSKLDNWVLEETASIDISSSQLMSGPICLQYDQGSVCIKGSYDRETANWTFDAETSQVPLALIQSQLPGSPKINGQVDLLLSVEGQHTRPDNGMMRLEIPSGNIIIASSDDYQQTFPLSGSFMEVNLDSGTLTGMAEVPAINENFKPASVNINISGYEDLRVLPVELPISGNFTAGGNDLSILTVITPELESIEGSFDIDVNIAGTLKEPQIQGKAELINASYQVLDLGIGISDINLVGINTPDMQYEINGQLTSGNGSVQASANVQQITEQGIELNAQLSGENFELVNLPELWAIVNLDVQSSLTAGDQYYQGEIMIPAALIDLDEARNATMISDDEVVDGKKINEQKVEVNQRIRVNITLGDSVEIKGMGITGKLSGQLNISNIDTNNVLVADGEIAIIDGEYSAYGQELTITEGKLIYNKVSLGSPLLSVRATRNVDGVTVGISVSGYISSPTVTLFSSASLPQEEILSLIVFGRPLNSLTSGEGQDLLGAATALGIQKSGLLTEKIAATFGLDQLSLSGSTTQNASIVVGKYINPRLYLSYGLGIIDKISTAKLNYKLSNRFSLEAERGQETGFDVFYNLEK